MCANFNGTSSLPTLAHSPWLEPTLEKFTVSCWVNPGHITGLQGVAQSQDADGYTGGWRMILNGSSFNVHLVTDSGTVDVYAGGVTAGVWTQLVMTYDGKMVREYINGVQKDSAALKGHVAYNAPQPPRCNWDIARDRLSANLTRPKRLKHEIKMAISMAAPGRRIEKRDRNFT